LIALIELWQNISRILKTIASTMEKTSYEDITSTPEDMRLYLQERALEYATAMVGRIMKKKKVSRSELASKLGTTPAWITQVLDGEHNKTIKTLSDLLWALGEKLDFAHSPIHGSPKNRNGRLSFHEVNIVNWNTPAYAGNTSGAAKQFA
jgi:DNA-binding phage protein